MALAKPVIGPGQMGNSIIYRLSEERDEIFKQYDNAYDTFYHVRGLMDDNNLHAFITLLRMKKGEIIELRGSSKESLLYNAARSDLHTYVQLLIHAGINVLHIGKDNDTALDGAK